MKNDHVRVTTYGQTDGQAENNRALSPFVGGALNMLLSVTNGQNQFVFVVFSGHTHLIFSHCALFYIFFQSSAICDNKHKNTVLFINIAMSCKFESKEKYIFTANSTHV